MIYTLQHYRVDFTLVYSFFIALLILCVFINISSAAISYHNTAYGTMLYKQDMADIREIVNYSDNSFNIIANSESIDAVLDIQVQDINANPMADLDVGLYYYPSIYEDNIINYATTNENGIASFDVSTELIYGINIEFGSNENKYYGPIAIPSGSSTYTYTTFIYTLENTESSIELRNINGVPLVNTGIEISLDENLIWTGTTDNNGIAIVSGLDDDILYEVDFDLPDTYCSTIGYIFTGYDRYYTVTATPNGIYLGDGSNSWCSWFTVSPDRVYQPGIDTVLDYDTDLPYDELVYTIVDYSTIDNYNYVQSIHLTDQTDSTVHLPELPTGYYKVLGKIEHDDTILDIEFEDFWIYDSNSYPEYDISISYPSTAVDNNLVISITVISNTGKIIGSLVEDNNEDNDDCCAEWGYCCSPGETCTEEQNVQAVPYSDGYINLTILLYDGPNVWHTVINDVYAQNTNEPVTLVFDVEYNSGTANNPPIASFTYVPKNPAVGQQISFTASSSYDPDGNIVSYDWDFEDGNSGSGVNPTHAYAQDGTYTVTLTVTDNDGATDSNSTTVVVGNIAPIVTIHSPPAITNDSTPLLHATFDQIAASTWYVLDNGDIKPVGSNTDNFTVTLQELEDGQHTVTVYANNSYGNVGSETQDFLVDIIAPAVPIIQVTSPTNVSSQTITGTMEDGATVEVTCPTATEGDVTYPTATTWSVDITDMSEGDNVITATATDQAGNTALDTATIVVDSVTTVTINDVTSPTNVSSQTITGTMENGATVEVSCPTATVGDIAYPTTTTWSVDITDMSEGDNVITATATDQAVNTASDIATIEIDPATTVTINDVTSPTNDKNQTVSGTMENGATVEVICSSATVGTVTTTDATWSVEITDMTEGDNVIAATATDQLGNTASDTETIVVDITAPIVTIYSPLAITNDSTPLLYATFDEIVASTWYVIDGAAGTGGSNTDNLTVTLPELADGSHSVTVKASDSVGNVGNATQDFLVDTIEPELALKLITEGNVSTLYINSSEQLLNCTVNNVKCTNSSSKNWSEILEDSREYIIIATDFARNEALRNLTLEIGKIGPTSNNQTNYTIRNVTLNITTTLNVSQESNITICEYDENPVGSLNTTTVSLLGINKFVQIEVDSYLNKSIGTVRISINYSDVDLSEIDEDSLKLHVWNAVVSPIY